MAYTFDAANKRIILSAGTTSIDVRDLYSRWKDWVLVSDNAKYLPVFSVTGGDTIDAGAGTSVPCYAFLLNGWRLRPQEANHTLNVTGGVLLVDGGGDPFVNTTGSFVVRINYSQPVQAITVSTGGGTGTAPTAEEVATAVGSRVIEAGFSQDDILKLAAAVLLGRVTGAQTNTIKFVGLDDTTERVIANVDQNGNRQGVTLTP